MPALTIKGIPDELLDRLRALAEEERRSMNQQAIVLLEAALAERRPSFYDAHAAFIEKHGPLPIDEDTFNEVRSRDPGRPSPFGEDVGYRGANEPDADAMRTPDASD